MADGKSFVYPRTRGQIEAIAAAVRAELGVSPDGRIAMQPILEFALDSLVEGAYYALESDREMNGAEGRTEGEDPVITLSASTYMRLNRGEARARMTVAHEIGHLLLHCGQRVFHFAENLDDVRFDPEWQADQFAAALMMPAEGFAKMRTVTQAMRTFGVSRSAAIRRASVVGIRLTDRGHRFGRRKKKERNSRRTP